MSTQTTDDAVPSGNTFLGDLRANFVRWNRKALRNPATPILEVALGVFALLMFTSVFGDAGSLALAQSGLSEVEYVTYLLPAVAIQVSMAAAISSGVGLIDDLDSGMFEKTVVAPTSPTAVFAGKAGAELLRIVFHLGVILALGFAMGVTVETGLLGVVGIVTVCLLFALWYMALSNALALLLRDEEALDAAANLLLFPLLFLSSGFLPVESLPSEIQTFATFNPVTYGVDAVRALVLGRDTMTVLEVTQFGGVYDTLVPSLVVLVALNLLVGTLAVWLLARASSSDAD